VWSVRASFAAAYFVEQRKAAEGSLNRLSAIALSEVGVNPNGRDTRVCISLVIFFGTSKRK